MNIIIYANGDVNFGCCGGSKIKGASDALIENIEQNNNNGEYVTTSSFSMMRILAYGAVGTVGAVALGLTGGAVALIGCATMLYGATTAKETEVTKFVKYDSGFQSVQEAIESAKFGNYYDEYFLHSLEEQGYNVDREKAELLEQKRANTPKHMPLIQSELSKPDTLKVLEDNYKELSKEIANLKKDTEQYRLGFEKLKLIEKAYRATQNDVVTDVEVI